MTMLFINPMWDNEAERIGKQKCTPFGYALHAISDIIGFIALLLLLGAVAYLGYRSIAGTFDRSLLWLMAIPIGLAFIGSILERFSIILPYLSGALSNPAGRE